MIDVEASSRGAKPGYIALRVERELLDQTDLKDSIDAILAGDEKKLLEAVRQGPPW
jgi:hypothetical protein